jgi:transcriptional regulator with XRE-family HTH domain
MGVTMVPEPLFGHWLRRRRKALDLSQKELARRVDCSPATIRKIEAAGAAEIVPRVGSGDAVAGGRSSTLVALKRGAVNPRVRCSG